MVTQWGLSPHFFIHGLVVNNLVTIQYILYNRIIISCKQLTYTACCCVETVEGKLSLTSLNEWSIVCVVRRFQRGATAGLRRPIMGMFVARVWEESAVSEFVGAFAECVAFVAKVVGEELVCDIEEVVRVTIEPC